MPAEKRSPDPSPQVHDGSVQTFEEAYQDLQRLVDQLDEGGLGLEDAVRLFERGMTLVAKCESILDAAELRVTRLFPEDFAASQGSAPDETV